MTITTKYNIGNIVKDYKEKIEGKVVQIHIYIEPKDKDLLKIYVGYEVQYPAEIKTHFCSEEDLEQIKEVGK